MLEIGVLSWVTDFSEPRDSQVCDDNLTAEYVETLWYFNKTI